MRTRFRGRGLTAAAVLCVAGSLEAQTAGAAWRPGEEWRVSPAPRLEIGGADADSTAFFTRVRGVVRLSEGRIAVADQRSPPAIRYYDAKGQFLKRVGREGAGPGEFAGILQVFRAGGDTLVIGDPWQGRFTYLGPEGQVARIVSWGRSAGTAGSMSLFTLGRFPDGALVARGNLMIPREVQLSRGTFPVRRDSIPLFILSEEGRTLDTLARVRGEAYVGLGQAGAQLVHFTPRPAVLVAGRRVFVGDGERYELLEYDRTGVVVRRFARPFPRRKVTSGDLAALREAAIGAAAAAPGGTDARNAVEKRFRTVPSAEYLPAHDQYLLLDPAGYLWVKDYQPPGAASADWSVFSPDARWLGTVRFRGGFRLLEVGRDYAAGAWTDEDGAERVQLYGLQRRR